MSDPRPPSAGTPRPPGATSVGERKKSRKGLWLALAAIAAVLALLLLLSQCGGEDDPQPTGSASTSSAATPSSSPSGTSSPPAGSAASTATSAPATSAPAGGAAQPGSIVTADSRSVLELAAATDPAAGLAAATGQAATGSAVQVLTVPADEGFWVGTSDAERVWVQLAGVAGESPYTVQEGDTVDFTGTVVTHDAGFAEQVGVDDAEGAAQLTGQAGHIEAERSSVVLSD